MKRRRERGFTLIELMVALVVSALLVGMILAIFSRMSLAYRGQQQIAGVQQVLAAARATIELDAKQAGFAMPQGFTIARTGLGTLQSPVQIVNSSTGPDQIAFFYADYADPTAPAVVTSVAGWPGSVEVDSTRGFADEDLVVLSTQDIPSIDNPILRGPPSAKIATYDACVLQIVKGGVSGGSPGTLTFSAVPPWGGVNSTHCTPPVAMPPPPSSKTLATMVYKFVAHAYRIDPDPARAAIGPLQGELISGGLLGTAASWTDLAYGFTDIQTALQVFESRTGDTPDPDNDPDRNWYSGGRQNTLTEPSTRPAPPPPPPLMNSLLQISISLVARTDRDVEGIATAATPQLTDPALQGSRIYRYTTFQVDFRNLGVGR